MRVEKTRCSGQWTEARYKGFIISLLRAGTMRWRPKHDAIRRAYVGPGVNPKTGHKCKLHKCEKCGGLFAQGDMVADHKEPVVSIEKGFEDWNTYIARMFVESDGFDAICVGCHAPLTKQQNQLRKECRAVRREQLKQ